MRKLKGLELRVVISANINSTIANILSPNLTLYDLQKPIYAYGQIAATPKKGRGHLCKMAHSPNCLPKSKMFRKGSLVEINHQTE